ncbi:MAG: hypothetical protein IKH11_07250, partial [Bacteroidales bacterium]|nr:hypothetical protein [Bacteroidales bacterium]
MKKVSRILAIALCLALILSITALAAWDQYQGNSNHNGRITDAATPYGTSPTISSTNLTPGTSGWNGIDSVPVMQTVNSTTFSYVLFDGRGTNGAQVAKYNCNTGAEVWRTTAYGNNGTSLNAKSGFQLSTPYLYTASTPNDESDDILYVGVLSKYDAYEGGEWITGTGSKLVKITGLNTTSPTVTNIITGIAGQINTPITFDGTYLYFGTYVGGSSAGKYYQVNRSTGTYKTFTPASYGFYWAGAYSDGTNVYFGSDNGKFYIRPVGSTFGSATGTTIDLTSYVSNAGNVRSTVVRYGDSLFFTSQGGYLWRYYLTASGNHSAGDLIYANIGGTSTSAPVISENEYI